MIGPSSGASTGFDPESNVLAAILRWVENGTAPNTIEGTKYVNDSLVNGVVGRRKHCRYPFYNKYISGNASLPESWECVV